MRGVEKMLKMVNNYELNETLVKKLEDEIAKIKEDIRVQKIKSIKYGSVIKVKMFDNNTETVALVDDLTSGSSFECLVLDINTSKIIADCRDIKDFINTYEVVEVLGDLKDLTTPR